MRALYVSHPQVEIDPEIPVPLWPLSADGRARAHAFAVSGVIPPAGPCCSFRSIARLLAKIGLRLYRRALSSLVENRMARPVRAAVAVR